MTKQIVLTAVHCADLVVRCAIVCDAASMLTPFTMTLATVFVALAGGALVFAVREILPINGPAQVEIEHA